MSAKKKTKKSKKISPSKTKPRSTRNMMAFINEQRTKSQSRSDTILDALRTLIDKAFERNEDLPGVTAIATYLSVPYDAICKVMTRMEKKRILVNISNDKQKKLFVPNEPDYLGDDA